MKNSFLNQFSKNIKFKYFCFDRVIIRGYILSLFSPAGIVRLLRALGFKGLSNGVMRILTDQLNGHIQIRAEFYFNGHNAIQLQLDKQGIKYRLSENAFVDVENPEAFQKAAASLTGRAVLNRINYWMNIFFKFDKGNVNPIQIPLSRLVFKPGRSFF